ncbi:hypothetical protein [Nitrosovibrio tenuis]|uniref:hypothetical protein n=1 Tax=Nitrosovibrio tenuis TaxID=1233 RepID=UPI00115FE7C1|nr:hypothetical protein [Nitrosovibrio tenuis]
MQFLSVIDKDRFARHFAIPTIEENLVNLNAVDGVIESELLSELVNRIFVKVGGNYRRVAESQQYKLTHTGPYAPPSETYFSEGLLIKCVNQLTSPQFFRDVIEPLLNRTKGERNFQLSCRCGHAGPN